MKLLDVKPFQETLKAGMCGPASLKMVLDFYGIEKSEEELAKLCKTDPKLGTDEEGFKNAAKELGLQIEIKNNSSFEEIQSHLNKNTPVIVDWFTRGVDDQGVDDGHYSVVVGLDEEFIYLMDPEIGGLRKLSRNDFMHVWFDFEGEFPSSEDLILRQVIMIFQ